MLEELRHEEGPQHRHLVDSQSFPEDSYYSEEARQVMEKIVGQLGLLEVEKPGTDQKMGAKVL